MDISGPVENERQKLDAIAKSLEIDSTNKTDEEIRFAISEKIGKKNQSSSSESKT